MEKAKPARSDAEILEDVRKELLWDTRVNESEIAVDVRNGVVTLTGPVGSYIERIHAVRAAHRVRGVLDVADEIEVPYSRPGGQTDTDLARAVRHALEWDAFVDDRRIQSTVSEGFVTLEGDVELLSQREDADRVIRRLRGVRGVLNKIVVLPRRIEPTAVKHRIEEALERRAEREADRIAVEVKDGLVTLTGRVHSWQERDSVVGAASHAPGVRSVRDKLRVDPWF
jgi:osmotically-inducible protein OsmY